MPPLLGQDFFSLKTLKVLEVNQVHREGLKIPQTIKKWMDHAWGFPDAGQGEWVGVEKVPISSSP